MSKKTLKITKMERTYKKIIIVAFSLIIMQIAISSAATAASNPIAYWKFDENKGTIASDSSVNNNHGTVSGATWTTGKINNALSFDGVNDYVNAGNGASLGIKNAITVETWFKPTRKPQDFNQMLVIKGDTSMDQSYGIYLRGNDDKIYFYVKSNIYASFSMPANMLNNWYHIVGTYDGTQIKVYLNGVQSARTAYTGTIGTTSKNLNIGRMTSNGLYFNGMIDEVRIYNIPLSESEILAHYNVGSSDTTSPTISSITSSSITSSSATISWTTNEVSDTQVEYGLTTSYGSSTTLNTNLITSHSQSLSGLTASTIYHYRAKSRDAAGNLAVSADNTFATPDTTPPTISSITSSSITSSSATISWTTNEASDTQVEYGLTTSYGYSTTLNMNLITSHSQSLSGLTASTIYHYRAKSRDAAGNLAVSGDQIFTTSTYDAGLGAYWKFDEKTGTIAADSSFNNNRGTVSGATWTTGKIGNALSFNGVNSYVDVGNGANLNITNNITMMAWIKSGSDWGPSDYPRIVDKMGTGSSGYAFMIDKANKRLEMSLSMIDIYSNANVVSLNQWYHVAVTANGSIVKFYVNGREAGTIASVALPTSNTLNLFIGDRSGDIGTRVFNGIIDEVRIYNRSLSASEIIADYKTGSSTPTPTVTPAPTPTDYEPIGGGSGYSDIKSPATADYYIQNNASNRTYFLNALSSAKSGDIIYIDGKVQMDLTAYNSIAVPAGVTIASDRGNVSSQGALLHYGYLQYTGGTEMIKYLFIPGPAVRFTGIRLRGPDVGIDTGQAEHSASFGIFSAYNIEIDNSDVSNWTEAIVLYNNAESYIHNNYIHHNLRYGLGYGINIISGARAIIEANIFDWNRHGVAVGGSSNSGSGYTARYNIAYGNGTDTVFDVHPPTGTNNNVSIYSNIIYRIRLPVGFDDGSIYAGKWYSPIGIRGILSPGAHINNNTFYMKASDLDYQGKLPIWQTVNGVTQTAEQMAQPTNKMYIQDNTYLSPSP